MAIPNSASAEALASPPLMAAVDMVWPDQSNHHGTLFGGAGLSILDRMAFIAGSKVLRGSVVTASVGQLEFLAPAPAGYLLECEARVLRRGRRSVCLHTRLVAEDLLTGDRSDCLSGEFVMVRKADGVEPTEPSAPSAQAPEADGRDGLASAMVAEIVFPGHANHRGLLHGGPAMSWMAKAGFVAATRQVRRSLVMAGSEKLDFKAPARVGDMVEVSAKVLGVGRRSVPVQIEMWAESPVTGERRHCSSTRFTYVVIQD